MKYAKDIKVGDSISDDMSAMVANGSDVRNRGAKPEFVVGHLKRGVIQCECGHDRFQFEAVMFSWDEEEKECPKLVCCRCGNKIDG